MKPRRRCRKCGSCRNLSKHHVLPKRHGTDGKTIWLCRTPCHDQIEEIIRQKEEASGVRCRLPTSEYYLIAKSFVSI